MFVINPILYALKHPDQLRLKIFYFSLEMSPEAKYQIFICHLLYLMSGRKIMISPTELKSTSNGFPLKEEVLEMMDTPKMKEIYAKYEECVTFISDIRNPTGIYMFLKRYAEEHGTVHKKTITIKNKVTGEEESTQVFDWYEQDDPEEYRLFIIDHLSLLDEEQGFDKRKTMSLMSQKYCVQLRNLWKYIPVVVQQQSLEQQDLDHIKAGRMLPSAQGLGDCKTSTQDIDVMIGIFSPWQMQLTEFMGYSIDKFRNNIRFMNLITSRWTGGAGSVIPLYFKGEVNYFEELPRPEERDALQKYFSNTPTLFFFNDWKRKIKKLFKL